MTGPDAAFHVNRLHPDGEGSLSAASNLRKQVNDLDDLVKALIRLTPLSKPWQRSLRSQLLDADRHIQILRMTVLLARSDAEVKAAARDLSNGLTAADASVARGRADETTKAALALASSLSKRIASSSEA